MEYSRLVGLDDLDADTLKAKSIDHYDSDNDGNYEFKSHSMPKKKFRKRVSD